MKLTRNYIIAQPARGKGGDKYTEILNDDRSVPATGGFYLNQEYSREDGQIKKTLRITVEG